jgi:hypothetical protein
MRLARRFGAMSDSLRRGAARHAAQAILPLLKADLSAQ